MTRDYEGLVARAKERIVETSPSDLAARLDDPPVIIDIREPHEMATGIIPGAALVPRGVLEKAMPQLAPDLTIEVVLYCAVGNRSALAALMLEQMGYSAVSSMAGGIALWRIEQHPVEWPSGVSDPEARYARHLVLPEIGEQGQLRLQESRVLIVGAGPNLSERCP